MIVILYHGVAAGGNIFADEPFNTAAARVMNDLAKNTFLYLST